MLAFSNDYYGFIFRATQSVELFCAYHKWYYQKRNSIAHYRAIHEPVKLDAADWNTMIKFNFEVIEYLYDK